MEKLLADEWQPWQPGSSVRPFLPLTVLSLDFRFDEVADLPAFRGALWRSVLGPQLKAFDAAGGWRPDAPSPLPASLFDWFFRPDAAGAMIAPDLGAALSPLVIDAPPDASSGMVRRGDRTGFRVVLAGRAGHAAQAVVLAFARAARAGLGDAVSLDGRRGRARLVEAAADGETVFGDGRGWLRPPPPPRIHPAPECPAVLRVVLRTPLRLTRAGREIEPADFAPADLLGALIRRVSSLMRSEAGVVLDADFRRLTAKTRSLRWQPERLEKAHQSRWSARQEQRIPANGLVGSFLLDMDGCEDLFDFLWLGLFLHAGKGAMAGMGGLAMEAL